MITLGVPKEIKTLEKRVGITPEAAAEIVRIGAKVLIQSGAGEGSDFSDDDYKKSGAEILQTAREVYGQADFIQKVKEPLEPEYSLLRPKQILFSYLHLASPENCNLVKLLAEKKITAIAYETLEVNGRLPLLAPMSEIAGALSVAYAAFFKRAKINDSVTQELEAIAKEYPVWNRLLPPGKVVIWGGGVAGQAALTAALKLGAEVTIIEKNPALHLGLRKLGADVFSPDQDFTQVLIDADTFVGSVHVRGMRAFQVLTSDKLKQVSAQKKKIIMDISIDQGGNFPEARTTSYTHPVYFDSFGNLRFCVANIPSLCGRAASQALSREVLPWTEKMVTSLDAWNQFKELRNAVNLHDGKIMIQAIAEAHKP